MGQDEIRKIVEESLIAGNGILRLSPAWVARTFLASGRRLGLPAEAYDVGKRGTISERWIGATNTADNPNGPPDEGLSYIVHGERKLVTLKDAVEAAPVAIMGEAYARTHRSLDRLAKIFDYRNRLPYHIHQQKKDAALLGRKPKEEAYYFPEGVDMGAHPETFFGVHPYIVEQKKFDLLLPHMVEWKDQDILKHARAYKQIPGEGFHLPAGVPHAPGTALTIELQEESDVFAMLQAEVDGNIIDKELLFKDVLPQKRKELGEAAILQQINWEIAGDPYFYEHRHLHPIPVDGTQQPGGEEYWIFYNSDCFSGKKLVVKPKQTFTSMDRGVYNILVWQGKGTYGGHPVEAGKFDLEKCQDELLVTHQAAIQPLEVVNTSSTDMVIFKFYGPAINPDAPVIPPYPPL